MPCAYFQLKCPCRRHSTSTVLISTFKPASQAPSASASEPPTNVTLPHLARSITFDLCVARGSLILDIISHSFVAMHLSSSCLVYAGLTSISALAAGTHPALQSLAVCIFQRSRPAKQEIGALFGGLSMLTALGQILAVSPSNSVPSPYPDLFLWCASTPTVAAARFWCGLLDYRRTFPRSYFCARCRPRVRSARHDISRAHGAFARMEGQGASCRASPSWCDTSGA